MHEAGGSRIFALIIGIDRYISVKKAILKGAARDARNMHLLLKANFGVPDDHICLLCDQYATRARIIEELKGLATNPNIQRGDAIIIYFAGHGNRASVPPEWQFGREEVKTICPVDEYGSPDSDVHGIPDITINALLYKLSLAKGENIVGVIIGEYLLAPVQRSLNADSYPRLLS